MPINCFFFFLNKCLLIRNSKSTLVDISWSLIKQRWRLSLLETVGRSPIHSRALITNRTWGPSMIPLAALSPFKHTIFMIRAIPFTWARIATWVITATFRFRSRWNRWAFHNFITFTIEFFVTITSVIRAATWTIRLQWSSRLIQPYNGS